MDPTRPTVRGDLTLADRPTDKLDYPNPETETLKNCSGYINNKSNRKHNN